MRSKMTLERRDAIRLLYPDTFFVPRYVLEWYEESLPPQLRFKQTRIAELGHDNLLYKSFVVTVDEGAPVTGPVLVPRDFYRWCEKHGAPFQATIDTSYDL